MNVEQAIKNLQKNGFSVQHFAAADEAAAYLTTAIQHKTVGMGGSVTLEEMGLFDKLSTANEVYWHWRQPPQQAHRQSAASEVYICSVNALAETGEIINIDGTGNRLAASLYGHEKVYFIVGSNKLAPDLQQAIWRARNVAAPLNARRLKRQTPCALGQELKCYDCHSPERICRSLNIMYQPTGGNQCMEVIIVDEQLGY